MIKTTVKKIHEENNVPEFLKMLKELGSTQVEFGIFGKDDSDILMIAVVNEFGIEIKVTDKMRGYLHSQGLHLKKDTTHIKIPERSFMRSGFEENKNKIINQTEKELEKVLQLKLPVKTFFKVLGEAFSGMIQEYLISITKPPNHPYTIEQKGSSNPLVNTGRLLDSITYRVTRR